MAPTILIIGATGNTGRSVAETLSRLLQSSTTLSEHRILALTRSSKSPEARKLATLPGVEVVEQNWIEITPEWLHDHQVVRAFVASHNEPTQFADESTFYIAALNAGVKYVVRISTTAANVRPDCKAYYARSHWAIEALLGSPEFASMQWTSLQPNVFSPFYLSNAVELIKEYRKTGKKNTLRLMASEDAPVGIVDPEEVGILAAHLLSKQDPTPHNKAKYVVNGPEDVTGKQVVDMVERYIGTNVEQVIFKDLSFLDLLYEFKYAATSQSKNVIFSIKHAAETSWEGKCSASTTSAEVLGLAAPKRSPEDVLKTMLEE